VYIIPKRNNYSSNSNKKMENGNNYSSNSNKKMENGYNLKIGH
jgi:hypothetical protein